MRMRPFQLSLVVAFVACAGIADAQTPASGAVAETLFRDGKALMSQGKYAEACPKLAESQRMDPGLGVLLALAFCHEKQGKTATAWSEFLTAEGIAKRSNEVDREQVARGYIERLEPKLVRVSIRVHPTMQSVEGFEVRANGAVFTKATWGMSTPVDLGEQVLQATAPGRKPWTTRFVVREGDPTKTIEVPALEPDGVAKRPPPPPGGAPESHTGRTVGYAVGGVGIAAVAVGAYFGVSALGKNDDAKALCSPTNCNSPEGIELNSDARSSATVSTVAIGVGLAAVAVGAYLVLTSRSSPPKQREAAIRLVPLGGLNQLGAGMVGSW